MPGEMHIPSERTACFVDGNKRDAENLKPRSPWSFDQGALCGDAYGEINKEPAAERQLVHTPSCLGCVRRLRAMLIEQGKLKPHERIISRPVVRKVAA